MPKALWIGVDDLLGYARNSARPSGIQRVTFEIYRALHENYGATGRVHFLRRDASGESFALVSWEKIAGLFERLTDGAAAAPRASGRKALPRADGAHEPWLPVWLRGAASCVPPDLRHTLLRFFRLQSEAAAALGAVLFSAFVWIGPQLPRWLGRFGGRWLAAEPSAGWDEFARRVESGDFFLILGAPWFDPDYAKLIEAHRARYGLKLALLLYDIIPLRRPEWFERGLVTLFGAAYSALLPLADALFAISRATADDLEGYAKERKIALRSAIEVVPIGTAIRSSPPRAELPSARLPPPGSFALCVSTIEPRKNHHLLFRVWRRLLEEMPAERVPVLVFAGQIGWCVGDFMRQLENADYLDGKIRLIEDPTDSELDALYRDCLFTLFPSLYEGWGLPVSESLARGKPCLSSNRTSLPEAGGAFARYFDPENLAEAYALIRATIEDREGLQSWESEIVRGFSTTGWDACAAAILRGLDNPAVAGAEPG